MNKFYFFTYKKKCLKTYSFSHLQVVCIRESKKQSGIQSMKKPRHLLNSTAVISVAGLRYRSKTHLFNKYLDMVFLMCFDGRTLIFNL